jgi:hypothetical protein
MIQHIIQLFVGIALVLAGAYFGRMDDPDRPI